MLYIGLKPLAFMSTEYMTEPGTEDNLRLRGRPSL